MGQTMLILGGGVGGLVAANRLRAQLPDKHRVVLVERDAAFVYSPSLLWLMTGDRTADKISRPLARLERKGIELVRGEIQKIDVERREVTVDGRVLQPVAELTELAHASGALLHTDAAQSLGKLPVRVRELGVDLLSIAGHKLYAPKGVGALYVKRGTPLVPFALGANHERGLRPGTENVASIVGLGAACEAVGRDLDAMAVRMKVLRDSLWDRLAAAVQGIALNGHRELRLPNTLNVRFPRASGNAVLAGAPEVAASTGSACHEGHDSASSVILAMGITPQDALGSVRLTIGRSTTDLEIAHAAEALVRSWRRAVGEEP